MISLFFFVSNFYDGGVQSRMACYLIFSFLVCFLISWFLDHLYICIFVHSVVVRSFVLVKVFSLSRGSPQGQNEAKMGQNLQISMWVVSLSKYSTFQVMGSNVYIL